MITINEMLDIIAASDGIYIKVQPADWVNGFSKPITAEELKAKFPEKYSNDLAGFEKIDSYTYYPKFATMQDKWDKELNDYISRKVEWCRKYGSE